MQPTQFTDAVQAVLERDDRFEVEAYYFLKDALDFTVKRIMESNEGEHRHVSASELLLGFRDLAIQEFGPVASTMMDMWNIKSCSDIGEMVFLLIEEGVFGKQDSDTLEDFAELYSLEEALKAPFLPTNPVEPWEKQKGSLAPKLGESNKQT